MPIAKLTSLRRDALPGFNPFIPAVDIQQERRKLHPIGPDILDSRRPD
jgi:hypothetical protein